MISRDSLRACLVACIFPSVEDGADLRQLPRSLIAIISANQPFPFIPWGWGINVFINLFFALQSPYDSQRALLKPAAGRQAATLHRDLATVPEPMDLRVSSAQCNFPQVFSRKLTSACPGTMYAGVDHPRSIPKINDELDSGGFGRKFPF